jgi:hypothetical protein
MTRIHRIGGADSLSVRACADSVDDASFAPGPVVGILRLQRWVRLRHEPSQGKGYSKALPTLVDSAW